MLRGSWLRNDDLVHAAFTSYTLHFTLTPYLFFPNQALSLKIPWILLMLCRKGWPCTARPHIDGSFHFFVVQQVASLHYKSLASVINQNTGAWTEAKPPGRDVKCFSFGNDLRLSDERLTENLLHFDISYGHPRANELKSSRTGYCITFRRNCFLMYKEKCFVDLRWQKEILNSLSPIN